MFKRRANRPQVGDAKARLEASDDPAVQQFLRSMSASETNVAMDTEVLDIQGAVELEPWFAARYQSNEFASVWNRRLAIGSGLSRDLLSDHDYFWVNAYSALAALELGQQDHPTLPLCIGLSTQSLDSTDTAQTEALAEVRRRYYG